MEQKITEEDVLLYIYNELPSGRKSLVEQAIASSPELFKFFSESLITLKNLNSIQDDPDHTVISILNEESRSSSMETY